MYAHTYTNKGISTLGGERKIYKMCENERIIKDEMEQKKTRKMDR